MKREETTIDDPRIDSENGDGLRRRNNHNDWNKMKALHFTGGLQSGQPADQVRKRTR